MTAVMHPMKQQPFARISIVIRCVDSNVIIIVVLLAIKFVMVCSKFNATRIKLMPNASNIQRKKICEFFSIILHFLQIITGVDNCGDGSDENNMTLCATKVKPCDQINQFKCANKKCIDKKNICDFSDGESYSFY